MIMTIVVIRKAEWNESHQAQRLTLKRPSPDTNEATPSAMKTPPKTSGAIPVVGKPANADSPANPRKDAPKILNRIPHAQEKRDMILTPNDRFGTARLVVSVEDDTENNRWMPPRVLITL